jgi:hypothetical protein
VVVLAGVEELYHVLWTRGVNGVWEQLLGRVWKVKFSGIV